MPCDVLVPDAVVSFTHAINLTVPPERAWPWLVQMGADRGGWYSWDRIDNGGRRSADRILPELQHIAIGDVLPAIPGARDVFVVARAEPPQDLVLHWPADDGGSRVSWEFHLARSGTGSRLVVRSRASPLVLQVAHQPGPVKSPVERLESVMCRLPLPLLRPIAAFGHRIMQARQLRGLKRRIERRPARGWFWRRAATEGERSRAMPGDDLVKTPAYESTRAITIRAKPSEIWPWLSQMGRGRGGLYSIDWLDRLFGVLDAGSATAILPKWQDLRSGDVIPVGRTGWPVHAVDRERSLVLRIEAGDVLVSNSWGLYPIDAETTRLVFRVRATLAMRPWARAKLALLGPPELIMVKAQLRGIRRRAESLGRARRGASGERPA